MTQLQIPYNVSITPSTAGLTFAGRNGDATRFTIVNNDSRAIPEVRINVLRADLMPSATMSESDIVKNGAGEKIITDKWLEAKMSTDSAYTAVDDWDAALTFNLDADETKSFDIKLVIPDAIDVQGKISFSLLISFLAATEAKVTSISIDNAEPIEAMMQNSLTMTATVTAEAGADETVTWKSSDESIFTIDSSGEVTPIATGKAIVTAISSEVTIFNGKFLTVVPLAPVTDGLIAWFDADDETTITETSGNVTEWADKSGNDYNAVSNVTEPSTGTVTLNDRNVIKFNNDYMTMSTDVIPSGVTEYTICAVWKRGDEVNEILVHLGDASYTNGAVGIYASGTDGLSHYWSGNDLNATAEDWDANSIIASWDGTTRTTRIDSVDVADTPTNKNTRTTEALLGGRDYWSDLNLSGYVAEILIYHRALTADEITQTETYFNDKWGV